MSVAVGVDGLLLIAYQADPNVNLMRCNDAACASSTDQSVGGELLRCSDPVCTTAGAATSTLLSNGTFTAMALGIDGTPQFLVRDGTVVRLIRPPA